MLGNAFGWPHLLIILAVILLLFGATRLPALSKSIGQSIKVFRKEMKPEEGAGGSSDGGSDKGPSSGGTPDGDRRPDGNEPDEGADGSTGRSPDKS